MNTRNTLSLTECREIVLQALHRLDSRRLLIVGDPIVDEFITGSIKGVSREAPVLVLRQQNQRYVPGGAANTAYNTASLGARGALIGLVGDDEAGRKLRQVLQDGGVGCDGLITSRGRPTSTKTRISAASQQSVMQQIVCLDREDRTPLGSWEESQVIAALEREAPAADAIIISDYKRGVVTPAVVQRCLELAQAGGKVLVVDSEGDLSRFRGATAITPNQPEAEQNLGRPIADQDDLEASGRLLLERAGTRALIITRGAAGMALFEGDEVVHIPVFNRSEVFDVTGAGDTVVATLALALACGLRCHEAMLLANLAASLVVRHFGTSTTTREEMREAAEALAEHDAGRPAGGAAVEAN